MERYVSCNLNPKNNRVGDCVIRAIALGMDLDWKTVYLGIALCGLEKADVPTANDVWGAYLRENGYKRHSVNCEECCTVDDFCMEHPEGVFILALQSHVVASINGKYYDTWDCGNEEVIYYWVKKEDE